MRRYFGRLACAFSAVAVLMAPTALCDFQKGIVNAEDVTLRISANASAELTEKLPRGAQVTVLAFEDGWFKVEYGQHSGFLKQDQLTLQSVANEISSSGKILLDNVNLRSKPSVNSSIVTQLQKETSVEVSEQIDNWYKITSGKNKGYVQCEYVSLTEAVPAAPAFNTLKMGMSGKEVAALQDALKALGYFKAEVNGSYGAVTRDAVKAFQAANALLSDGVATLETQALIFAPQAVPAPAVAEIISSASAQALDWAEADAIFPAGTEAQVTDVRTGTVYSIRRVRGVSHAEVETLSKADTDAMLSTCGGEWSKEVRPVILTVGDKKIAAAIRPFPRGKDPEPATDNSLDGLLALHFKGCVVPETRRVSPPFQAAVVEALKAPVPSPTPVLSPAPSPSLSPMPSATLVPSITPVLSPVPSITPAQ